MFTYDNTRAGAPGALWFRLGARRALREAQDALDEAGILLMPLIGETDWRSDGVRALHDELRRLQEEVGALGVQLRAREWELEAAP